ERAELREGFVDVMSRLYDPVAYFSRLDELYMGKRLEYGRGISRYWRRHPLVWLRDVTDDVLGAAVLFWGLMRRVPDAVVRRVYRRRFWQFVKTRPNARLGLIYLIKCAIHYHLYTMTRNMAQQQSPVLNTF